MNTIIAGFVILSLLVLVIYMYRLAKGLVKAVEKIASQSNMSALWVDEKTSDI